MKFKKYLITGGCGFIGSNYINFLFKKYSNVKVLNVDKMTYAADVENIELTWRNSRNYQHLVKDINDLTDDDIKAFKPDIIINFAAETHVDLSIKNPKAFIQSNINGTFNLLELSKKNFLRLHQVSTDEVYGSLEAHETPFNEYNHIKPSSPYSASKAAADMLVMSYHKTYKLPVSISRCSNNFGPRQFPEKLIPLVIKNIIDNKPIPIYGNGLQKRDWIHVDDHCRAIDMIINSDKSVGEVYNIGAENEVTNIDLINKIIEIMTKLSYKDCHKLIKYVTDRKGHDVRYAIDNYKIKTELGFYPKIKFETGLKFVVNHYVRRFSAC
jgi:dTDP-glucose 4,6-dehydratase